MKIEYDPAYGLRGTVSLLRGEEEAPEGTALRPLVSSDGGTISRQWSPLMTRTDGSRYRDAGWKWDRLVARAVATRGWFGWILQRGSLVQGACILRHPFMLLNGSAGVFVERLATAPWNRTKNRLNEGVPRNKLVGSWLMYAAVATSLCLGSQGRCALDSLTGSEDFYKRIGMSPRPHRSYQRYFELQSPLDPKTRTWISQLLSL